MEELCLMSQTSVLIAHRDTEKINREQLALVPCPPATDTHKTIAHHLLIDSIEEALGFRHIAIHKTEFAVSADGNKLFGLLELDQTFTGCRFALGLRNSHDKTMRLSMTVGYRVFICDNMAFTGDFSPILAKHSKHFSLTAALAIGIDQMQRNFKPMVEGVDRWRDSQLTDVAAKMLIYRAFVEGDLDAPRHLDKAVHKAYFEPQHEEFQPRTIWSLQNAFTTAFKQLEPIPQYKATAKLGAFMEGL